jgi:serine/threonine protein kinase
MYFQEPSDEDMEPYIKCFDNEVKNMQIAMGNDGDNENAVKFFECFEDENEYAIVMELCDTTLLSYLNEIRNEEKFKIINQLNKTTKIMVDREAGYIDIRLENILIKFTNKQKTEYIIKLKLTDDIGLTKQLENLNNNENMIEYNCIDAPEIIKEGEHSNKSDLWS